MPLRTNTVPGLIGLPAPPVTFKKEFDDGLVPERSGEVLSNRTAMFEVATVDLGLAYLQRFRPAFTLHEITPGVLLAGSETSVRGFHDETSDPEHWVERAVDLSVGGARAIGGGAGTTEAREVLERSQLYLAQALRQAAQPAATVAAPRRSTIFLGR